MSDVEIQVRLNGESVPLYRCSWYEIASCGCTSGATLAHLPDHGRPPIVSEDQAWASFARDDDPRLVAAQKARGARMELGLCSEITERMKATCPHEPRWGVPVDYAPDGWVWATHLWPGDRKSSPKHLVPADQAHTKYTELKSSSGPTLCGKEIFGYWMSARSDTGVRMPCTRCSRKAAS